MGRNAAENHPVSMKWVMKAKEAGAKIISVDPQFTRSSSVGDFYRALRSGTDIAFLGGMIYCIIDKNKFFKEYVENYTNALAQEKEIKNGERVVVSSIRGEVECAAMVTPRIRPFKIGGKTVHQVAMPFAFGWLFPKTGKDSTTNLITPGVGDGNTMCPEYKGFRPPVR